MSSTCAKNLVEDNIRTSLSNFVVTGDADSKPPRDYFQLTQFLNKLGLVDMEAAQLSIQMSKDIKTRFEPFVSARLKEMLSMIPLYYIENGKVKRYATAKSVNVSTSVKKRTPKKKQRVYFSSQQKRKQKCTKPRQASNRRQRCYRSGISVSRIGLNIRSKNLLDSCCDLSIRVHRMSDADIVKKMWETANLVGPQLNSTEIINSAGSRFKQNKKTGFTNKKNHDSHPQQDVSVDLYRMTEEDIQNKGIRTFAAHVQN